MSRTLKSISYAETLEVTAKSLKKGDPIWIGKRVLTVKSNDKNDFGDRVIRLRWGTRNKKDEVTMIVPRKHPFNVRVTTNNHIR